MEEKIKTILAGFLKTPAEQITDATIVNRSAVSSSILLHRMYAKLHAEGLAVKNYMEVNTFGDLLRQLDTNTGIESQPSVNGRTVAATALPVFAVDNSIESGIGIDIEMISSMPPADDFREDSFYTMNFSTAEISWCILQPNPYASFAGLFAAKEALVKADNQFRGIEFRNIVIQHLDSGKPVYRGFNLSISHAGETAVAIAAVVPQKPVAAAGSAAPAKRAETIPAAIWVLLLASLCLSVICLFLIMKARL
jgi:phosphopantetheine--protein transferase-like protein